MNLAGRSYADSDELEGASLRCTNLVGASLAKARLGGANLENTRLLGANLHGADLAGVRNLTQAQLDSACVDSTTRLPPGLRAPPPCANAP